MNIRRLLLDIDKSIQRPSLFELAETIEKVAGVDALNITVNEIDQETMGMNIVVEGENINYAQLERAIENTGAVIHSVDQIVCGNKIIERIRPVR